MFKFHGKHFLTLFIAGFFLCGNFLYAQKNGKVKSAEMSATEFKSVIWDFTENEKDFIYKGKKPAIVYFYSPLLNSNKVSISILDELVKDSRGRFDIYRVNAEQEKELVRLFEIKDYPTFLLITRKGEPQVYVGVMTKEQLIQLIDNTILK